MSHNINLNELRNDIIGNLYLQQIHFLENKTNLSYIDYIITKYITNQSDSNIRKDIIISLQILSILVKNSNFSLNFKEVFNSIELTENTIKILFLSKEQPKLIIFSLKLIKYLIKNNYFSFEKADSLCFFNYLHNFLSLHHLSDIEIYKIIISLPEINRRNSLYLNNNQQLGCILLESIIYYKDDILDLLIDATYEVTKNDNMKKRCMIYTSDLLKINNNTYPFENTIKNNEKLIFCLKLLLKISNYNTKTKVIKLICNTINPINFFNFFDFTYSLSILFDVIILNAFSKIKSDIESYIILPDTQEKYIKKTEINEKMKILQMKKEAVDIICLLLPNKYLQEKFYILDYIEFTIKELRSLFLEETIKNSEEIIKGYKENKQKEKELFEIQFEIENLINDSNLLEVNFSNIILLYKASLINLLSFASSENELSRKKIIESKEILFILEVLNIKDKKINIEMIYAVSKLILSLSRVNSLFKKVLVDYDVSTLLLRVINNIKNPQIIENCISALSNFIFDSISSSKEILDIVDGISYTHNSLLNLDEYPHIETNILFLLKNIVFNTNQNNMVDIKSKVFLKFPLNYFYKKINEKCINSIEQIIQIIRFGLFDINQTIQEEIFGVKLKEIIKIIIDVLKDIEFSVCEYSFECNSVENKENSNHNTTNNTVFHYHIYYSNSDNCIYNFQDKKEAIIENIRVQGIYLLTNYIIIQNRNKKHIKELEIIPYLNNLLSNMKINEKLLQSIVVFIKYYVKSEEEKKYLIDIGFLVNIEKIENSLNEFTLDDNKRISFEDMIKIIKSALLEKQSDV